MADPWNFAGPVTQLDTTSGVVTLVDESTFAISGRAGDVTTGGAQGLFFRDTRILSRLEVLVNGDRTESLAALTDDPFRSLAGELRRAEGHASAVYAVAFSPDGKRIVTSSADGTARLWDAGTGATTGILRGHRSAVATASIVMSSRGSYRMQTGRSSGSSTSATRTATDTSSIRGATTPAG